MELVVLLCLAGLVLSQGQGKKTKPTPEQLATIKGLISAMFDENLSLLPTAVRLPFHDCVGERCDGCINYNTNDNNGLERVVVALDDVAKNPAVAPFLGNADLWSLAGIVAVEDGIKNSNKFCTDDGCLMTPALTTVFKWGRVDCASSPTTNKNERFPFPEMSRRQMMTYFKNNFGFNENEVTALLGAHSLGRTTIGNSGYNGPWTTGRESHFSNQFYALLRADHITYSNDATDPEDEDGDGNLKYQFNLFNASQTVGMMLNTDVELAFNIDVSRNRGTRCQFGAAMSQTTVRPGRRRPRQLQCTKAPTIALVDTYIDDPAAFVRDFSAAFEKMMDKGNPQLETVAGLVLSQGQGKKIKPSIYEQLSTIKGLISALLETIGAKS